MAQIARSRTKINTNPTQTRPVQKSRQPVSPGAAGQTAHGLVRLLGEDRSSSRDSGRVVVEVGWGLWCTRQPGREGCGGPRLRGSVRVRADPHRKAVSVVDEAQASGWRDVCQASDRR